MKLGDFAEAIWTRIWEGVGRANWRNFEDARAFARVLGLKSSAQWLDYCQSGKKPADIPASPEVIYANNGWSGINDWLDTGKVAPGQHRAFTEARAFARSLELKSIDEWLDYCKSGKKPADIPVAPHNVYANDGWSGWGDWLGTGKAAPGQYRSFTKARAFAREPRIEICN